MHAVFKYKGNQYFASENETIKIKDTNFKIDDVILISDILIFYNNQNYEVGNPLIKDKIIKLKVLSKSKEKKISILKFRRRKHYMKRSGYRQKYTNLKILYIGNK